MEQKTLVALIATLLAGDADKVGNKTYTTDDFEEVADGISSELEEITDNSNEVEGILRVVYGDKAYTIKIVEEEV